MRRVEMVALRCAGLPWERLEELLPGALDSVGLSLLYEPGGDGKLSAHDHRSDGTVLFFDDVARARRTALALASRSGTNVDIYEVVGTAGKRFRFRTEAFVATGAGELKTGEGRELDLEDAEQTWGGGDLEKQAGRVLEEFSRLDVGAARTKDYGYKRRPAPKPSSPRVAQLLATLKKARSHQAVPQPNGRVELRLELAAGGRQTSYCTAAEYDELQRILG